MGKGKKFRDSVKKKDDLKKEELPSLSTLTLTEGGASTSAVAPTTAAEPATPAVAVPATPAAAAPIVPKPAEPKQESKQEPEDDDDEGGLGLGLGKSKKKRRKKPKDTGGDHSKETTPAPAPVVAGKLPSAAGDAPSVTGEPPSAAAAPPAPAAAPPAPAAAPPAPTAGWGARPAQATQQPHLVPPAGVPAAPPGFAPRPGQPIVQQAPQVAGRGQGRGQRVAHPGAPAQWQPTPGFPAPSHPATPAQWQPPPAQWQPPPDHSAFPAPSHPAAQRQPTPAQTTFPGPSHPATPVQGQVAPPRPTSTQSQSGPSGGDVRKTPPETVCRYKIPDKIIGTGQLVRSRMIKVLANYLPMSIQPIKIHRYDVTIKPDKPKKMIPRAFSIAKNQHYPKHLIAFDQMKNCYALKPLPNVPANDRFTTNVEFLDNNGKTMKFEVSFKATGIVDLNTIKVYMESGGTSLNPPTEAIQCVDVILRQGTLESYVKAGRQFFKRPARPIDLGDGLEMWTGLFQSAIFTSTAFVNIDVAHKGFPKNQPMLETLAKDFRMDLKSPLDRQRGLDVFQVFIKGLRVIASIGGDCSAKGQRREFICNELVGPASSLTFTTTDAKTGKEKQMSVADYFLKEKNVRLRYPHLNCMWVGPRDKKIYYPLELLEVSYGQALNKQLNERQLSTMVREAATPPDERKRKIDEVITDMNYSKNQFFQQFGLRIGDKFVDVEARVLMPPSLDVGMGGRPIQPAKGQWQANRLLKPEPLESWAIISISLDVNTCNGENIVSLLKSCGSQLGMRVAEPKERYYNIDIRRLKEVLFDALKREIRFLVIIVPTRGKDYYHIVKQTAERDVGILTQCIREMTAQRRMNPQTAKNILLKVNSKLMGINQALDKSSIPRCLAGGGVMVVGADVTHPSPDQTSVPSIAAVTASIDPKCFIYNIQLSVQTPKKEMIVEFEDMMVVHLQVYKKRQGALPHKIFVFRDGVSEGQFAEVMNSELQAVHRAYQKMTGKPNKPEVLFLLVQKRHHTRFFNTEPQFQKYNVEPGTVVDKHIVHARELDFYLVSHQAIKGTARPTRYHAVCNDGKIPHDEVEQLTYYLCHLYSRCMRAVSYPTPTYYAHLACLRARSLTYGQRFDNNALERNPVRLNVLDKMLEFSRMFFV